MIVEAEDQGDDQNSPRAAAAVQADNINHEEADEVLPRVAVLEQVLLPQRTPSAAAPQLEDHKMMLVEHHRWDESIEDIEPL